MQLQLFLLRRVLPLTNFGGASSWIDLSFNTAFLLSTWIISLVFATWFIGITTRSLFPARSSATTSIELSPSVVFFIEVVQGVLLTVTYATIMELGIVNPLWNWINILSDALFDSAKVEEVLFWWRCRVNCDGVNLKFLKILLKVEDIA